MKSKKEKIKISKKLVFSILVGIGILCLILALMFFNRGKIDFQEKFKHGESYYIFYKDGTCKRATAKGEQDGICTYIIDGDDLKVTTKEKILGSEIETVMSFQIIDKNNIKHYMTAIAGVEFKEATYGNVWSSNGKEITVTDEVKEDKTETKKAYIDKTYDILKLNNGKSAKITFKNNGLCTVDFSSFNNRQKTRDYMQVSYVDGLCSYKTSDDKNFVVSYTGELEVSYNFYHSYYKKMQKQVIDKTYTMRTAELTFDDDYSSFNLTNGKFTGQTGEVFYYYYQVNSSDINTDKTTDFNKNDDANSNNVSNNTSKPNNNTSKPNGNEGTNSNKNDLDNNNSTDNKNNNVDNNKDNNDKPMISEEEKAKKALEQVDINIKIDEDKYIMQVINSDNHVGYYTATVNGKVYSDFFTKKLEIEKNGHNVVNILLKDKYGNSKTFVKEFTFTALEPKITIFKDGQNNGRCVFKAYDNSGVNYNYSLTCTIDGAKEPDNCRYGFYVSPGNHKFVFTNKYGVSTTIEKVCKYN